jgi:hypothetical protein
MQFRHVNRKLLTALVLLPLGFSFGRVAYSSDTQPAPAHLTAEQVTSIALDALRHAEKSAVRFTARTPRYDSAHQRWWVFFVENAPPYQVDGGLLVVVDDVTSRPCVQHATAVGPCI